MLKQIISFCRKEAVLCISAICALITMLLVPPDSEYAGYIDLHVLILLFCLMTVIEGFQACGVFRSMTYQLLRKNQNGRILAVVLVLLPFFSSMLVTNDVALLVFVPFTLGLLTQMNCIKYAIPVLVLQTIAANLGSMATPVGNPQNLFLYSAYELSAGEFFSVTLPLTFISGICLVVFSAFFMPKKLPEINLESEKLQSPKNLAIYTILFILCLLTVFRVIPHIALLIAVILSVAIIDRRLLKKPDYALLLTFVCFFIVSGNLGRVEEVNLFLQTLLNKSTLFTATGASQIISNVPAAVLLSGFTEEWKPLLEGVNIGGLGTPIASLASLITLKQYLHYPEANAKKFILFFTVANIIGLIILLTVAYII